jgi:hypothetical protein
MPVDLRCTIPQGNLGYVSIPDERRSDMAADIGVVEIDWNSRVGVSIKISIGVLSSQGGNIGPIVLNDAVDILREGCQLGSGGLHGAVLSNRCTAKERNNRLLGVVSLENSAGVCSRLVIGKGNSDSIGLADLEGRGGNGNCQKRKNSSEDKLHFEIEGKICKGCDQTSRQGVGFGIFKDC